MNLTSGLIGAETQGPIGWLIWDNPSKLNALSPGMSEDALSVIEAYAADPAIKVPHMGWNDVAVLPHARDHDVIEEGEAYFLHSYHFAATDPHHIAAMTDHGQGLVAAVARDNILGVQFHPEKSQAYGLATLRRFLEWYP